jgi:cytochrome c oxidase subunit 4
MNPVVAVTIAIAKATLIVLFFMNVKYSTRLTWIFVAAGFFWLIILFGLLLPDYVSRDWQYSGKAWGESALAEPGPAEHTP